MTSIFERLKWREFGTQALPPPCPFFPKARLIDRASNLRKRVIEGLESNWATTEGKKALFIDSPLSYFLTEKHTFLTFLEAR